MTFTPKTPAFEKAVKDSRNLKAKPDNDELLQVCPTSNLIPGECLTYIVPILALLPLQARQSRPSIRRSTQAGNVRFDRALSPPMPSSSTFRLQHTLRFAWGLLGQSEIQRLAKSRRRGSDIPAGAGEVCEAGELIEGEVRLRWLGKRLGVRRVRSNMIPKVSRLLPQARIRWEEIFDAL